MTLIQYTAEVKEGRLLELPTEAEELHLKPGDKVQVQLALADAGTLRVKAMGESVQKPKELKGRGMLAGVLNSEDFMRRKREETLLEDRSIR